ncbi:hypothetical protein SRHO_G00288130 [Serrasalmus rhombeus]
MLQRVLSTVRSLVERLRSRSSARYIQAEVEDEHEDVSQARQLIPLGAPAGVLTVNLKTCRDFSKSAPLKKGSRAAVRITIGRTVKYTVQQPYSDPMCFDEWKHFSLQVMSSQKSVALQEMEQDMELRSPPSPTAYNCFSKKDRIQERQREEEQQVPKENDVRRLEEMVKQQEMEIARFHKRQERLKQKLEKTKAQLARKEQKTLKILQRYKHLKRERLALKEKEREEDKVTSKKTVDMIDTVNVREEKEMDSKREQQQEKEEERKRAREKYMERKEQRRAERRKKFPQKETSFGPEKRDQPPASTESKAEDLTSETPSQVQTDGPTSGEAAEENPAWGGHDGGEAVIIEVESQQRLRSRSSARYIQAEVEDEHEDVSQARQLIPLGAPAGVLTVNLKTCRDFSKSAPLKKGSRAAVRITIGRTVKYTVQQPYSDPMCFDEWKHFSLQIQKEDICGVQQSSLVVVELIMVDPDLTTPILIGRDTIMLREILKKSSLSHQFNLRLMQKKVCKLDADLAFSYGSMGYGYSHQIKQAGRTAESLVEKSLFPRCPPNEDRDPLCNVITPSARTRLDFIPSVMLQDTQTGTECRISAGLKDCIQKRGRLLHLHQGLDECKTGEDRVQFLEKLILKKSFSSSCPC